MDELILHLGAHKTATTFIQKQLEKNARDSPEIGFAPLGKVRDFFTNPLRNNPHFEGFRRKSKKLLDEYSHCRSLTLSDENILGNARLAFEGRLYEDLPRILDWISRLLGDDIRLRVVFCIRRYSDYLPSLYSEYLRHNDFCTIDSFVNKINMEDSGWLNVFDSLVSAFGKENVFLYDFDLFDPLELLDLLTPSGFRPEIYDLPANNAISRSSLTRPFIQVLEYVNALYDERTASLVRKSLEQDGMFSLMNKGDRYRLDERVCLHLDFVYEHHYWVLNKSGRIVNTNKKDWELPYKKGKRLGRN